MKSPFILLASLLLVSARLHAAPPAGPGEPSATPIRLNSIGYPPDAPKHASIPSSAIREFTVIRVADGSVALTGKTAAPALNADTDEQLVDADFSALRTPGEYRLHVADAGESPAFHIASDVYREPFILVTRAMYLWRCGTAVDGDWHGTHFHHDACHLDDAWTDFVNGRHERRASLGGWHDAGDYNKYVVNAGVTVGAMLRAWEDFPAIRQISLALPPATGAALPDFLAEIKYETDWLLTMQADDGSVYTKVSTTGFSGFELPEQEKTPRYFCPAGTPAAADFVAMLAQAARAFRPYAPDYADRCLAAARKTHAYLAAHPADQAPDQSKFHTGGYPSRDPDERLWAAAELWETTSDAAVLKELELRIGALSPAFEENFDWPIVKNLGLLTYLFSTHEGRSPDLVAALRKNLPAVADAIVAKARAHGYARPLDGLYSWGGNGCVARQTLVLQAAWRLTHRAAYRDAALDANNHLLGRNVHGRSYITGLGFEPPQHPHDRRSAGNKTASAWPGYLVGGPHPRPRQWRDDEADYTTNEIAINWNGALIYAFAGFVE